MSNDFAPRRRFDGSISDTTMDNRTGGAGRVGTSLLRGVVVRVKPYSEAPSPVFPGVLCDVFIYSTSTATCGPLNDVLVTYPYSGLQEGDVMLPRGCTRQMTEIANGILEGNLTPAQLDGDHVLIGFIDGELSLPVIVSYLPHPDADVGKAATDPIGYRTRPLETDGTPAFRKHQGVYAGVDTDGNYEANTTKAHKGVEGVRPADAGGGYTAKGEEVSSTETVGGVATSGNYTVKLKKDAKLLIEFESGNNSIQLTDNNGVLDIATSSAVNITADSIDLAGNSVDLGTSASDAALLGTTYRSQESAMLATIQTTLTAMAATVAPLAAPPLASVPITGAVLAGILTGPISALLSAISSFESGSSSYLSTKVDIG